MICAASDLHGQWDKYQELVKRLALNDGENELYLLGDLIDRGSGSCKILLDIRKRDNIHALFGNHEYMAAMCLSWVLKEITKDSIDDLTELQMATLDEWILNGGGPTLRGLRSIPPEERQDLLEYLHDMELYAEVEAGGKDFVLIHAAPERFDPDKPLEDYEPQELLFGRPDPSAEFWPDKYLVYGHTPTRLLHEQLGEPPSDDILRRGRQIAIDCACAYDGKLGCLCLDTLEEIYV